MKSVSLFSGIGGFDLGFQRAGIECVAVCEIDKNAQSVLRRHFPHAELFDDVRKVGKETHGRKSIDLVCGGFPCQDVSIAGKRAGLAGERSGLWFEFARVIDELEPQWVVIENVPGLLSSNGGRDIQIIIDALTQIGYTVDIDIKDAQEFGVPQRRRRVFLTCVRLDDLLQRRTDLSKQISADLLSQILLNAWGATQQVSSLVPLHSVYEKPIERCVSLLSKMTGLLEITRERLACKKYQNGLDALLDQFGEEGKNSESGLIKRSEIQKGENSGKTVMYPFDLKAENGDMNISSWLREYLDAVCETGKGCTTSTLKNQITDHQIYIFSVMALLITERILLSTDWSESYWSAASSLSTLIQENMNYARQASNNLFIESGLRDSWRDYLSSASNIQDELERRVGNISAAEVLFERESGERNITPSREAGKEVAYSLRANPSHSGDKWDGGINKTLVPAFMAGQGAKAGGIGESETLSPTLKGAASGTNQVPSVAFGWNKSPSQTMKVAETTDALQASPTSNPAVFVSDFAQITSKEHGSKPSVISQPLNTLGQMSVWHNHQQDGSIRIQEDGTAPTVSRQWGTGGNNVPFVGVRRLLPVECERLQGFPDGWTDGQSDSTRYRQLGNAVAVPVIEWIGNRIISC